MNPNNSRVERLQEFLNSKKFPQTYIQNSLQEDDLIRFTEEFQDVFHKYFPHRKPLLLIPMNECNHKKMICTFIRPCALKYDELFDMDKCSQFIARYMQYEPLHDLALYGNSQNDVVEKIPTQVISPATALEWQRGNCLEMCLVLVSLLCGSGYNAFVIVGYAHAAVCLNDQSKELFDTSFLDEGSSDDMKEASVEVYSEYANLVSQRPVLRQVGDLNPDLVFDKDQPLEDSRHSSAANSLVDTPQINALHCWVWVLPGGRKAVSTASFIEPTTGKVIPMTEANKYYLGVESIFNNKQYFVNLKPEVLPSLLSTDLRSGAQWEEVFSTLNEVEENDTPTLHTTVGRRILIEPASLNATTTSLRNTLTKSAVSVPCSWTQELVLTPSQYANRYPGSCKEIVYANAVVRLFADYSQPDLCVREITTADSLNCAPTQVHFFYTHRADKLRRRSLFSQADFLIDQQSARVSFHVLGLPLGFILCEWYERGRVRSNVIDGLRELMYIPGVKRTTKFYWKSREDGLCERTELFYDNHAIRKIKEFYKGRTDRLCYRGIVFEAPKNAHDADIHDKLVNAGYGLRLSEPPRLEPVRLSQKYLRNSDVPANRDVAKIFFSRPPPGHASAGEMTVFFHYAEGSIIRPFHVFPKPSSNVDDYVAFIELKKPRELPAKVVTMPGQNPPSELELYTERKWLSTKEAECLAEIREAMDEHLRLLFTLEEDHKSVERVLSAYDTLRNRLQETEAERMQRLAEVARIEESKKDYLAPYIAQLETPSDFDGHYLSVCLTAEQAKLVRDAALSEQKERLIQRGQIMQTRMNREKEEFNRRQQTYQKNFDSATIEGGKDAEEFASYCKEATWRMKVLDERLAKHVDQASNKYAQLASRLAVDPRLSALYNSS